MQGAGSVHYSPRVNTAPLFERQKDDGVRDEAPTRLFDYSDAWVAISASSAPPPLKDTAEDVKWAERLRKPRRTAAGRSVWSLRETALGFYNGHLILKDTIELTVKQCFNAFFIFHFCYKYFLSQKTKKNVIQTLQMFPDYWKHFRLIKWKSKKWLPSLKSTVVKHRREAPSGCRRTT